MNVAAPHTEDTTLIATALDGVSATKVLHLEGSQTTKLPVRLSFLYNRGGGRFILPLFCKTSGIIGEDDSNDLSILSADMQPQSDLSPSHAPVLSPVPPIASVVPPVISFPQRDRVPSSLPSQVGQMVGLHSNRVEANCNSVVPVVPQAKESNDIVRGSVDQIARDSGFVREDSGFEDEYFARTT